LRGCDDAFQVPFGGIRLVDCDYYYLLVYAIVGCYDMNKATLITSQDQATWVCHVIGILFDHFSRFQHISNYSQAATDTKRCKAHKRLTRTFQKQFLRPPAWRSLRAVASSAGSCMAALLRRSGSCCCLWPPPVGPGRPGLWRCATAGRLARQALAASFVDSSSKGFFFLPNDITDLPIC